MARLLYILLFLISSINLMAQSQSERCPVASEGLLSDTGYIIKRNETDTAVRSAWFEKGSGVAFRYFKNFDCPDIYDEEYTDNFGFSIPFVLDSFRYVFTKTDGIPKNVGYIMRNGGWMHQFRLVAITGELSGNKLNGKWNVTANLNVTAMSNRPDRTVITREIKFNSVAVKPKVKKKDKNVPWVVMF